MFPCAEQTRGFSQYLPPAQVEATPAYTDYATYRGHGGYALAAAGLYTALAGVYGSCPASAMIGRKPIDEP